MVTEVKGNIPTQEWEYLEGVLDQSLQFGVWGPYEGSFVHRIDFHNTSNRLTHYLHEQFGGRVIRRHGPHKNPPGTKDEFVWTIANAASGLEFLGIAIQHLHFKRDLATRYADFLQALLENGEDIDNRLADFRKAKAAPPSPDRYLPSPKNLAGRLDTNGFIGIEERSYRLLRGAYALVMLGTPLSSLGRILVQEYGGSYASHRISYYWTVRENKAANILRVVSPHLRNKKDIADLVLEFQRLNQSLTDEGRREYIIKSRQLNTNPA